MDENQRFNLKGEPFDDLNEVAIPCGLIAKSIFTDKFWIYNDTDRKQGIKMDEESIAWESDHNMFNNINSRLPEGKSF